jgi:voltage-gated potassium channel
MKIFSFDTQRTGKKPERFSDRRERLHQIVFESETRAGKLFDIVLLGMILLSIMLLMLETVPSIQAKWGGFFYTLEWVLTIFFTIEYSVRLYCVYKPFNYATSFYGLVDIASILPVYLDLLIPGAHSLMIVRSLRLLRLFRIFKLNIFINQGNQILQAIRASREKILVFTFFVMLMVFVFGSVMYVVEGPTNPKFDSIPTSIYWAVVTITTVGYGDISPVTPLGKFISSLIMMMGYAVIAVPTGIVTSSLVNLTKKQSAQHCAGCSREGHDEDALFCKYCGTTLGR